jgi:uncharacterized protein (DUF1697 family)
MPSFQSHKYKSTYIALLRGINVGGNNIIKMTALKEAVEKCGFDNVSTYIQSGNVIFESEEHDTKRLVETLELALSNRFDYQSKVVVVSRDHLQTILDKVPIEWKTHNNLRCYIAFVKEPMTAKKVLAEINIKSGVDFVRIGRGVLYMSTLLSGITKSGFTKLVGTNVYQHITIRNYNTAQKILAHLS